MAATAALYLYGLSRNGWANAFYSAAAQAGSKNWEAWFFGSSDAANSITVDKPPLSTMVMALSARMFGLNYWSILVPQALMGVASVGVLYAAVKRWYGAGAGLLAGALLAVTPVAVLMFRFNNPDALLVLLLVGAAYATVRAIEKASPAWLMLAGALVGLGFLTKMMQAFLVVPAFLIAYAWAAPSSPLRRLRDLVLAFVAMIVAGGWWVAIVELTPPPPGLTSAARSPTRCSTSSGATTVSDGSPAMRSDPSAAAPAVAWARCSAEPPAARQVRRQGGMGGPGGGGPGFGGGTGIGRLFGSGWAGGIAWLIPAALVLLIATLWLTRRAGRTDRLRAGALLGAVGARHLGRLQLRRRHYPRVLRHRAGSWPGCHGGDRNHRRVAASGQQRRSALVGRRRDHRGCHRRLGDGSGRRLVLAGRPAGRCRRRRRRRGARLAARDRSRHRPLSPGRGGDRAVAGSDHLQRPDRAQPAFRPIPTVNPLAGGMGGMGGGPGGMGGGPGGGQMTGGQSTGGQTTGGTGGQTTGGTGGQAAGDGMGAGGGGGVGGLLNAPRSVRSW